LGAKDASHAHFHTEANASHIRVALKDDNLGLGAIRGSGQGPGECTGLDAFQGLLGRLNGKTEGVLEREQRSRDDLKRAVYMENRWGALRFVSGGLLIGDKIERLEDEGLRRLQLLHEGPTAVDGSEKESETRPQTLPESSGSEKLRRKEEKRQRKLEKRLKREAKKAVRAQQEGEVDETGAEIPAQSEPIGEREAVLLSPPLDSSIPEVPTFGLMGSRHAVRQRHIQQKRRAVMDTKALNEILMIKA